MTQLKLVEHQMIDATLLCEAWLKVGANVRYMYCKTLSERVRAPTRDVDVVCRS